MAVVTVADFLAGSRRNAWIGSEEIEVYVRKGLRRADDKTVHALDIASVEVAEHLQGQGIFRSWYQSAVAACREADIEYIFVESVLSDVMAGFCKRQGFTEVVAFPPCFIKKI
jgi:N-acetylglutamate synthase-like GNAT family acetyltransferase